MLKKALISTYTSSPNRLPWALVNESQAVEQIEMVCTHTHFVLQTNGLSVYFTTLSLMNQGRSTTVMQVNSPNLL